MGKEKKDAIYKSSREYVTNGFVGLLKVSQFQNEFSCLQFSKKQSKHLKDFCPENLKSGLIQNIEALYYVK